MSSNAGVLKSGARSAGLLLPFGPHVHCLDFDLFQRYSAVAKILDRMFAEASRPIKVLEVGCNVLNLIPNFLDPQHVKVMRCDVVGDSSQKDFVLIEKDKPLPFGNESFDAVIALEVLEHMPAGSRRQFIWECLRVARRGIVLTCPNGIPKVSEYEDLWSRSFENRRGAPHPWLREHIDFGLPREKDIVALLEESGFPHAVFGNAPLDTWLAMMMLSDNLHGIPITKFQARLNEAYFKGKIVGKAPPYRKIYVCAKTPDAAGALEPGDEPPPPVQKKELPEYFLTVDHMATTIAEALNSIDDEKQLGSPSRESPVFQNAARESDFQFQVVHSLCLERLLSMVYHSPTWKIGLPWRVVSRMFFSRTFNLDPSLRTADIKQVPGEPEGTWLATTSDPQFFVPCMLPAGWVRLRLKMTSDVQGFVELFFDVGGGYTALNRMELTYNMGRVDIDRHIHLAHPLRILRFDPLTAPGRFHIEHFSIEVAPQVSSLTRSISAKVGNLLSRGRGLLALRTAAKLLLTGNFKDFKKKLLDLGPGGEPKQVWNFPVLNDVDRARMRQEAAEMPNPPLISVIFPTYNTPEKYLRMAIDSVLKQIYQNWELCIADDCSTEPHVRRVLEEYQTRDKRIKVTFRKTNGHISQASNSALELAKGEFVALLDHDDEIAEQALLRAAQVIVSDRSVDMIYTDEDKLDMQGRHMQPFFKPDWSPEYFLACMYTCHLGVYRTSLVREIGGFRSEYDTAQDYDLVLRIVARTKRVRHIPEVLYHWRAVPTSTASGAEAKPKAHECAQRAIRSHLEQIGRKGTVENGPAAGFHRVRFEIVGKPLVSIIIPSACRMMTINGQESSHVIRCIDSIFKKTRYRDFEVLVVDRQQMPPQMQANFEKLGVRRVTYNEPFNWSRVNNIGVKQARGSHYLFLNDDMEVITDEWLDSMVEFSQLPDVGVVGAKLIFPDERLQHVGVTILGANPKHLFYGAANDTEGYFNSNLVHRNLSAVTGACLMTRADVFHELGGFTEEFPYNYNDVDYCLKALQSGRRVVYTPYARLYHFESATKTGTYPHEVAEFQRRWAEKCQRDEYFPAMAQLAMVPVNA